MYTPKFSKPRVLSVSQLNFYIKSILENDPVLQTVFVEAEISNLAPRYQSGHVYFSLKDEKSVVSAVMFAGNARRLVFKPENGMKVICRGRVSVYEPSGKYQIIVEDMQPQGSGALAMAFEQLKRTLDEKGLFDSKHKKPIPQYPKVIGVITSPSGAAVQDIRNVLSRRYPSIKIIICPVLVQGETAAPQMINALELLNRYFLCDVIIIGRGGGSMEDLWAFNNEQLAYAVFRSKIPVISAVGHETDFTICDFVSDLRAPTPSAAAELAVPDAEEIGQRLAGYRQRLDNASASVFTKTHKQVDILHKRLEYADAIIDSKLQNKLSVSQTKLMAAVKSILHNYEKQFVEYKSRLNIYNPQIMLERGLASVTKDGSTVSSKNQLSVDDKITVRFGDGEIGAVVTEV